MASSIGSNQPRRRASDQTRAARIRAWRPTRDGFEFWVVIVLLLVIVAGTLGVSTRAQRALDSSEKSTRASCALVSIVGRQQATIDRQTTVLERAISVLVADPADQPMLLEALAEDMAATREPIVVSPELLEVTRRCATDRDGDPATPTSVGATPAPNLTTPDPTPKGTLP